ncbi:MAG: TIGR03618 family F420-dependent PPOX class oxidoreductase [Actinophytocola sp.]|nr:TIGR03618 family F420-dependent PPOX class oxidoreductase [Actinophytocola sp.]
MTVLNAAARELISSGALGHLVTLNPDGSPQVAVIWLDVDGDELIAAHLNGGQRKLRNIRRDPRVAVSFEGSGVSNGLRHYLVVHGTATITEGGAPELLHKLAQTYIGPGTDFPPMPDPPPGCITHIRPTRVSGVGSWADSTKT